MSAPSGTADFDVCVVGSGGGGGPVAFSLARAGYSVVVLEKGPWLREADFVKDEISQCRRRAFVPSLRDEPQVVELRQDDGSFRSWPTPETGWDFWNGSLVGGASNLMSGFFLRLKPVDFRLRSELGAIDGAEVADWPIDYDTLEPWYARVEGEVGVSGRVVPHPFAEPRSTPDFPLPPTLEHPFAAAFDATCVERGLHPLPLPRAVLSHPHQDRISCSYTGFCGSYGCATGAKGSARAAFIDRAVATGRCEVRPHSMVRRLVSDERGRVVAAEYHATAEGHVVRRVDARVFVVACQAVETARLLLLSTGPRHAEGLGNRSGQVGRNLVFSTAGWGEGAFPLDELEPARAEGLRSVLPFVNRSLQDWYLFDDPESGARTKGGTIDFLLPNPNPIAAAVWLTRSRSGRVWGQPLKERLERYFKREAHLMFEVFADWLPTPDGFVTLDRGVRDRWGQPVAKVRIGRHRHNHHVASFLADRGREVLEAMGAEDLKGRVSGNPATNLIAGGCRFGTDPATSVLDPDCRAHDTPNLFVTDGSFMPTGGSVPYTWTIYANALRVAGVIAGELGG